MARRDTTCREEARDGMRSAGGRYPGGHNLAGILFAGGVLEDAVLSSQTSGKSFMHCDMCLFSWVMTFQGFDIVKSQ